MYKNANKLLLSKEDSVKINLRHSITLGRIEQNMKKVRSMIHILTPPTLEDVLLFNNPKYSDEGMMCCDVREVWCGVVWCDVM